MQNIHMQSNEHFEVFTTVLSPQVSRVRRRHSHGEPAKDPHRNSTDQVVVIHSDVPDEVTLTRGEVILALFKEDESRWFGQLQNGQQGHSPASCVIELSHNTHHRDDGAKNGRGLRRHSSVHVGSVMFLREHAGEGKQQAPRGTGGEEGPFLTPKQDAPAPCSAHSSPSLLHRLLSKHRRRNHSQGASNGAFEPE